jgi:anti-anti-sigma regulatory factor/DNA-binding HxlR family transcriptional regulator
MKFLFEDEEVIFSLVEEPEHFRMKISRPEIDENHVEQFMDKTVEWLSTNPEKGILIDFAGVKSVCSEFAVALNRYYEDIKRRGLHVRFVNVDPLIEPYVDVTNITVVMTIPEKPVLSARELLEDLANDLSDKELMRKHGLSPKGLASMFRKLLRKGLISRRALARRMGVETREVTVALEGIGNKKVTVDAGDVLKDIAADLPDPELRRKYKLSPRGLQSLLRKLYRKGLITKEALLRRKALSPKTTPKPLRKI